MKQQINTMYVVMKETLEKEICIIKKHMDFANDEIKMYKSSVDPNSYKHIAEIERNLNSLYWEFIEMDDVLDTITRIIEKTERSNKMMIMR